MRIFIFLLSISFFFVACNNNDKLCLTGDGDIVSKTLDLDNIHSIVLDIPADIILTEATSQKIEVSAQQNIIDEIMKHSVVSQGVWRIKVNRNCLISEDIRFFVNISELKMLSIDGSGNISTQGTFENVENIDLDIDGSGSIDIDLSAPSKILAIIDGSGKIKLNQGSIADLIIDIDGSGDVEAFGLVTEKCNVSIDGSGDVEVQVSENLEVSIDGSGDLCYKGDPLVISSINGSGSINNCN